MDEVITVAAATLVLFRSRPAGPPALLMLERAGSMAFAPGALVFPGGRVDPGDRLLAGDGDAAAREDGAARIAAIRETIEEAGIAVGLDPAPDGAAVAALRAGLARGEAFADLLAGAGLTLDRAALTPFARWCPNVAQVRNFDTRFYLAEAPAGGEASIDGGECVGAIWAPAAELLRDADAGRHRVIFPTRRNLERLARFADFAEALADTARHPPRLLIPRIERRDDGDWLTIPDDLGYPITAERLDEVRRG